MNTPALPLIPLSLLLGLLACTPVRDNPNDPDVKPSARIVVQIGGVANTIGGRGQGWVLDGSQSSSPASSIRSFTWEMASQAAASPDATGLAYLPIGSAVAVTSSAGQVSGSVVLSSSFHAALASIQDFGPTGEQPTTRYVRLTVADRQGRTDRTTALLTLINHGPLISLGPDLRVSPGGKWWLLAAGDEPLSAQPMSQTLSLTVTDADGDQGQVATAASPARWAVSGALAATYDLNHDGLVDDSFFADPGHRSLTVTLPVVPSRSNFTVTASDVGAAPDASTTLQVNVLSNIWAFDSGTGEIVREDTSRFLKAVPAPAMHENYVLATDGSHELLAEGGAATLTLHVVDQTLRDVQTLSGSPATAADYDTAASDGAKGWWVMQGGPLGTSQGTLFHFSASGATLLNDGTFTSMEGTSATDFIWSSQVPLATTAPAATDVWTIGCVDNSPTCTKRLYRITTGGALGLPAMDAFPAGGDADVLAPDGSGGVWIGGRSGAKDAQGNTPSHVRHVSSGGTVLSDLDLAVTPQSFPTSELVASASFDSQNGSLWVGINGGNYFKLARIDSAGGLVTAPVPGDVVFADPSDHSVLVGGGGGANQLQVLSRFAVSPQGGTLEVVDTIPFGAPLLVRGIAVEGGSLLLTLSDELGNESLAWLEAAASSPRFSFQIDAAPNEFSLLGSGLAVDPATGFLWIWREGKGVVEVYSSAGVLLHSIPVIPALPAGASAPGSIAIDPQTRTAWVDWAVQGGASSGLTSIALDAPVAVASATFPQMQDFIGSLAVVPGGQVCLAAQPAGLAAVLMTWDPVTAVVGTSFAPTPSVNVDGAFVEADPLDGSCWFALEAQPLDAAHISAQQVVTQFSSQINPGTGAQVFVRSGAALAPWSGLFWVGDLLASNATDWVVSFGPFPSGIAASAPAPALLAPDPFAESPLSIAADPFYHHLWAGFGSATSTIPGTVVRLDAGMVEVSRDSGFVTPVLHSTH